MDVNVAFEVLSGAEVQKRVGDPYDGIIFLGGWDAAYAGVLPFFAKYVNPALDAAFATGQHELARTILERDVPLTPLYRIELSVAADTALCDIHPTNLGDPLWMADIRPCGEGEGK